MHYRQLTFVLTSTILFRFDLLLSRSFTRAHRHVSLIYRSATQCCLLLRFKCSAPFRSVEELLHAHLELLIGNVHALVVHTVIWTWVLVQRHEAKLFVSPLHFRMAWEYVWCFVTAIGLFPMWIFCLCFTIYRPYKHRDTKMRLLMLLCIVECTWSVYLYGMN